MKIDKNEFNISVRLTSLETKQVTRHYEGDWPWTPFLPSTEEVTEYTLTFGEEGSDRQVMLRGWDQSMVPEVMRQAELGTPFRLRLTNELTGGEPP